MQKNVRYCSNLHQLGSSIPQKFDGRFRKAIIFFLHNRSAIGQTKICAPLTRTQQNSRTKERVPLLILKCTFSVAMYSHKIVRARSCVNISTITYIYKYILTSQFQNSRLLCRIYRLSIDKKKPLTISNSSALWSALLVKRTHEPYLSDI